jgi:hypothetical protein
MKDLSRMMVVVGALSGCGAAADVEPTATQAPPGHASAPATAPTDSTLSAAPGLALPREGPRTVDENLARLRSLEVFTVGQMVWEQPAEAFNCYGPCPGSEAVIARAEAAGAARLDAFTRAATAAARDASDDHAGACEPAAVDANLQALRALRVVEVQDFLAVQPRESSNCYGLVCPGETARARAETCARAEHLADIVDATRGI